jgi:beta-alanine degradation protein BauB
MDRRKLQVLGATVLALAAIAAVGAPEDTSRSLPVTQLRYASTGVSDGVHGEVKAAAAYGDSSRGAHGTFLKLPPGFASPLHTHRYDEWGVIISGVAANGGPSAPDIPLPPGSYFFQKASEPHVTKCLSSNECILFLSQPGKYDLTPTGK